MLHSAPVKAWRRWRLVAVLLIVGVVGVVGVGLRLQLVTEYHAPAGDGHQYHRLAQELRRDGRFAFGPPPAPLSFVRLPGYPLFLAAVTALVPPRGAPLPLETHLRWATRWNVALDLGSATLTALTLWEAGLGAATALVSGALVLACPLLIYLASYGLSESLATFLTALQLFLVARALRAGALPAPRRAALRGPLGYAALLGVVAGLAQLVRVDSVTMLPPLALGLYWAGRGLRQRALLAGAFVACFAVVFSPWPLRNLARFGAPQPFGTTWMSQDGRVLPTGMMRWMMTWGHGAPGESYLILLVANSLPLSPDQPGQLMPVMYDSPAERERVAALFHAYNRGKLSPEVDAAFIALANERARRAPLRTFVVLPAKRLISLWRPIPSYELPFRSSLLGLPRLRPSYDALTVGLTALGLLGAAVLAWQALRARSQDPDRGLTRPRLLALMLVVLASRSAVHCYAHPFPLQRYLAEAFPALLALAACAITQTPLVVRGLRRPRTEDR